MDPASQDNPSQDTPPEDLRVRVRARVARGTSLNIQVEHSPLRGGERKEVKVVAGLQAISIPWITPLWKRYRWEGLFFILALGIYLATRLVGLEDYPIFFFTDEAVQTVQAKSLLDNHFYSPEGEFLPTYFLNSYQYNLSTSVYLQVLPTLLLGKSVFVTRATVVLVSLLAALAMSLTLRQVFGVSNAWLAAMLFSITPAWFLHSRTAFETGLAVTFYACFLYTYLRYRHGDPRWLYAAVFSGVLMYYSYSPARAVIGLCALVLFVVDIRYHFEKRLYVLAGLGLAAAFSLPLLRFWIEHPESNLAHLKILNSYWVHEIPLGEKLGIYFSEYLKGLNPLYWFVPNETDLPRHLMRGYGNIRGFVLPFFLLGTGIALWRVRRVEYRTLLIGLLAAPAGAALVAIGITRVLSFVVPAALLSGLGVCAVLGWLNRRFGLSTTLLGGILFVLLAGYNLWMLQDALKNGPLWHDDYGLAGMQYGARQLFGEIREYLKKHPQTVLTVSPSWSNGTDTVASFFFDVPFPFNMGSIEGYMNEKKPLSRNNAFVMIPSEMKQTNESGKFKNIVVEETLPYPDGTAGFYFVRLEYGDDIDRIFEEELERRRTLTREDLMIDHQAAEVLYSTLDMGEIGNAFDHDDESLIRGMEANPLEIVLTFREPRTLKGVAVRVGSVQTLLSAELTLKGGEQLTFSSEVPWTAEPKEVSLDFGGAHEVKTIRLLVKTLEEEEPTHVHIWEVELQ